MARAQSELLTNLIADAEISSSFFNSLDKQLTYGEITREEHLMCLKSLRRIFSNLQDVAFTHKKNLVKQFIKEAKKNESMPAR